MNKYVTTIGNFDGVHLGHQAILRLIKEKAKKYKCHSKLITFNPYPFEYFDSTKLRISSDYDKDNILDSMGIDSRVYCEFNEHFKDLSAEEFFNGYLRTDSICIVVGKDFRFGKDRQSGISDLRKFCDKSSIEFYVFEDFIVESERVSSTQIRLLLKNGEFKKVKALLGRSYKISGKVNTGMKVGRTIQTPTANVQIDDQQFCFSGVFLCKAALKNKTYYGIANFGPKPSFDDYKHSLEVNLFNFNDNIYGEILTVEFLHKIREQIKFSSIDDLKSQIKNDQKLAKDLIKNYE